MVVMTIVIMIIIIIIIIIIITIYFNRAFYKVPMFFK